MTENERRLLRFAVIYLQQKLEESYELHPEVQRIAGVCNGSELNKMLNRILDKV